MQVQIIIYVLFGLIVLAAGIGWIPWRKIGEHYFSNDPTKGLLYIEFGEDSDCVLCQYIYSNEKGAVYSYKWRGQNLIVAVRAGYGFLYLHGRRKIRLANPGDAWASDWSNHDFPPEYQKSAADLNAMIKGHVGVELVRSIYGKKAISMMMVLIIAGACVAGYYFYNQNKAAQVPEKPPVPKEAPADVPHAYNINGLELVRYV